MNITLPATAKFGIGQRIVFDATKELTIESSPLEGAMQIVMPARAKLSDPSKVEFIAGYVGDKMAWILISEDNESSRAAELQAAGYTIGILGN